MENKIYELFSEKCNLPANTLSILRIVVREGKVSAGKIAEALGLSIPTVTKTLENLIRAELVLNLGREHVEGGRKPVLYGPNPNAAYFAGVDVKRQSLDLCISDFAGNIIWQSSHIPFLLDDENAYDNLLEILTSQFGDNQYKERIAAYAMSLPGRVNKNTGESISYLVDNNMPLAEKLGKVLGAKVYIENDCRILCYSEYISRHLYEYSNILYINLNWGLGMGMILNGQLYYGASGFSGELGHVTMFDNEIFCRCGKKGCIETEASGFAVQRLLLSKHKAGAISCLSPKIIKAEPLELKDFIQAVYDGDMTTIEIIEEVGTQLGKGIAAMINIFNPELVILGGELSKTGDYLRMATVSSIRKYSLNIVNRDTIIQLSSNPENISLLGCCYIARDKALGIL